MRILHTYTDSKIEKVFISFLVHKDIYSVYMKNLAEGAWEKVWKNWNKFKLEHEPDDWIEVAFTWDEVEYDPIDEEDSFDFWREIHSEWCDVLEM